MADVDGILEKVVGGVITTLCGVVALLWKDNRRWQRKWETEHDKRLEDLKEHGRTSVLFQRALEKSQRKSSEAPPSNR